MDWKKQRWVWHSSLRYMLSKRKEKSNLSVILSILGITLGVMALLTVLSVMNGFQQNYINNINDVLSYHIRIENNGQTLDSETLSELEKLPWVLSVTPFTDVQTLVTGTVSEPGGALIRGLPSSALTRDESLNSHLTLRSGQLNLKSDRGIILGNELARSLGLFPGDSMNLMTLKGSQFSRLGVGQEEFILQGTFRTGYYEYDSTLGFISLGDAQEIMESRQLIYGVKVHNRMKDRYYRSLLLNNPLLDDCKITTWRDYNKAFFNALMMEKIMMILMVSLIFIVVALNIFHSLKRSVAERIEEIALYKAMGAGPWQVRGLFLLQGLLLSTTGTLAGLLSGFLLSKNVNQVFRAVEAVVNTLGRLISSIFRRGGLNDFSIYSSRDFYLLKVPVVIMGSDMSVIALAAIGFSLIAALKATSRVAGIRPAEVFSYE